MPIQISPSPQSQNGQKQDLVLYPHFCGGGRGHPLNHRVCVTQTGWVLPLDSCIVSSTTSSPGPSSNGICTSLGEA